MSAKKTKVFFTFALNSRANIISFSACTCLTSVVQMKPLYPSSRKVTLYTETLHSEYIIVTRQCRLQCLSQNRGDATDIYFPHVEFSLLEDYIIWSSYLNSALFLCTMGLLK